MKKILFLFLLLNVSLLYAQTIDYRQVVFGNSYKNITEIDAEKFFEQYPDARDVQKYSEGQEIHPDFGSYDDGRYLVRWFDESENKEAEWSNNQNFNFRVYEEKYGGTVFYRILFSLHSLDNKTLLDWKHNYYDQELFYREDEKNLVHIGSYSYRNKVATQGGDYPVYNNVEIIHRKDRVLGVMPYCFYEAKLDIMEDSRIVQGHFAFFSYMNDLLAEAEQK